MHHFDDIYPFSAIVGQEQMKFALLLNATNPRIGGVLIKGEKGTAKSTAARALAHLFPNRLVVDGCTFGCDPDDRKGLCLDCQAKIPPLTTTSSRMRVIELPISATEDKVVGSLDIEHALKKVRRSLSLVSLHRHTGISCTWMRSTCSMIISLMFCWTQQPWA